MFCTGLVAGWSNCCVGVIALNVDMIFFVNFWPLCGCSAPEFILSVLHKSFACLLNFHTYILSLLVCFLTYVYTSLRVGTFHFHDGRW